LHLFAPLVSALSAFFGGTAFFGLAGLTGLTRIAGLAGVAGGGKIGTSVSF
jgi:hypothetical protein